MSAMYIDSQIVLHLSRHPNDQWRGKLKRNVARNATGKDEEMLIIPLS